MTAQAAVTREWRVGARTCRLTVPRSPSGLVSALIEWLPDLPERISSAELQAYQAGRNAALAEIAQELGIRVAVVDL